jgi:hypothetical protein
MFVVKFIAIESGVEITVNHNNVLRSAEFQEQMAPIVLTYDRSLPYRRGAHMDFMSGEGRDTNNNCNSWK